MIALVKLLLNLLYNMLPNSPIAEAVGQINFDFLPYLNWVVPFDNAVKMTRAWLSCILLYYSYNVAKKVIFDVIIKKITG